MVRIGLSFVLAASVMLFSQLVHADVSQVTASVDRNPVTENQSFVLTVSVDDDVPNDSFSPSDLLDDFVVGRTSVNRQTSIINGSLSKKTTFTTVLIPQSEGTYTIPAFTIEGVSSTPIDLRVNDASETQNTDNTMAFIRADITPDTVYLQQPITYTARLYLAADLNKGNLVPPQAEGADIQQIGRDSESTEVLNGKRYKVYQRVYQITPSQSGTLDITGARFDGEIFVQGQRSIFSSFSNTQPVSTIGDSTQIKVLPIPDGWQGHWLPSELVSLSQSAAPEQSEHRIGEPITLSYMLTAVGVKPEQLPDIRPDFPDTVRVYPDGNETDQFTRNGVVISQKTISFAVVPNQAGNQVIPGVNLPWFNTKTGQAQTATTNDYQFTVPAAPGAQTSAPEQPEPARDNSDIAQTSALPAAPANGSDSSTAPESAFSAPTALVTAIGIALALSLLLNLYLLLKNRRKPLPSVEATAIQDLNKDKLWQAFQKACQSNDPKAAKSSLVRWAQHHFNAPVHSLQDVSEHLALGNACHSLNRALYEPGSSPWKDGKLLYRAVKAALSQHKKSSRDSHAPPTLYGESSL